MPIFFLSDRLDFHYLALKKIIIQESISLLRRTSATCIEKKRILQSKERYSNKEYRSPPCHKGGGSIQPCGGRYGRHVGKKIIDITCTIVRQSRDVGSVA